MQKKILIVSPITCYPPYWGNSARIAAFIDYFRQQHIDFRYLHLPECSFDPAPMIAALGNHYMYETFRTRKEVRLKLFFRAIQGLFYKERVRKVKVDDFLQRHDIKRYKKVLADFNPDIVWINYTYFSKLFQFTPAGIEKILDTHDSLHVRFKQLYNGSKKRQNFRISIEDEIKALNRADKVIGIQATESEFFKVNGCQAKIYTIGYQVAYQPGAVNQSRHKLLYIGANYSANVDALNHFLKDIWPVIANQYPTLELYIAGGICEAFQHLALDTRIKLLGYISDLAPLYHQMDIAINPVRIGSGLKIKNIEALSYGVPIITTGIGAEGLEAFESKGLFVVNDIHGWTTSIEKLMHHDAFYTETIQSIRMALAQYNELNNHHLHHLFND